MRRLLRWLRRSFGRGGREVAGGLPSQTEPHQGFLGTLASSLLAAPLAAEAQQAGKVWRIDWLLTGSLESPETRLLRDAFAEGLRERGYIDGQNSAIEYRPADGRIERFPRLASELVRLKLDAQQATTTTLLARAEQLNE